NDDGAAGAFTPQLQDDRWHPCSAGADDGEIRRLWQFIDGPVGEHAIHRFMMGRDGHDRSIKLALQQIAHDDIAGTRRLVGGADNSDGARLKELLDMFEAHSVTSFADSARTTGLRINCMDAARPSRFTS